MGREIKRVPLDFDWPIGCGWPGYMINLCSDDIAIVYCMRHKDEARGDECDHCAHFARLAGLSDCPSFKIDPPIGDGWQLWETVSEGSPITPVFATAEELIDHMCQPADGDRYLPWDKGWSREVAESFVRGSGWAPSLVITGGVAMDGVTGMHALGGSGKGGDHGEV
jgi:hypothetical protein